jgi:hypothetical protein
MTFPRFLARSLRCAAGEDSTDVRARRAAWREGREAASEAGSAGGEAQPARERG